uniref:Uncharacterized protein n=1 Tax=Parascaris equorum TaxID=6256 RepID=A0A914S2F2_PAREQ
MRASIDTNWTVGGVFEKKLSQNLPFTLAISGMLNHVKAQGKFGIGLIIGNCLASLSELVYCLSTCASVVLLASAVVK